MSETAAETPLRATPFVFMATITPTLCGGGVVRRADYKGKVEVEVKGGHVVFVVVVFGQR